MLPHKNNRKKKKKKKKKKKNKKEEEEEEEEEKKKIMMMKKRETINTVAIKLPHGAFFPFTTTAIIIGSMLRKPATKTYQQKSKQKQKRHLSSGI